MPQQGHPRGDTTQPNRLVDDVHGGGSPWCTFRSAVFRRLCGASLAATALTTLWTNWPCAPNARLDVEVVAELSRFNQVPGTALRCLDRRPSTASMERAHRTCASGGATGRWDQ